MLFWLTVDYQNAQQQKAAMTDHARGYKGRYRNAQLDSQLAGDAKLMCIYYVLNFSALLQWVECACTTVHGTIHWTDMGSY
jgi:hypothetical protein